MPVIARWRPALHQVGSKHHSMAARASAARIAHLAAFALLAVHVLSIVMLACAVTAPAPAALVWQPEAGGLRAAVLALFTLNVDPAVLLGADTAPPRLLVLLLDEPERRHFHLAVFALCTLDVRRPRVIQRAARAPPIPPVRGEAIGWSPLVAVLALVPSPAFRRFVRLGATRAPG